MRVARAAAVCLAVAAAAGCGGASSRTTTFEKPAPPPAPVAGTVGTTALAPEARARAIRIARANGTLRRLLRPGSRVMAASPWSAPALDGASLTFSLPRPVTVDADLPQADIPPDAPTKGDCARPYRLTWLHEHSTGVTRLYVLVDVGRRRVADVTTNAKRGTLAWVPGRPHPSCEEIPSG